MEKLNPTSPAVSPPDLPRPSSSSSSASSPTCTTVEQHSPPHDQTSASSDTISSPHPANKAGHKGHTDVPTADPIVLTNHKADKAAAPEPFAMETQQEQKQEQEQEEKQEGPSTITMAPAASASRSPTLSSPPPLLPAPAKTSPCPAPPPTSTTSFPVSSSSSPLPPHIPVISLGHSKPPLPLPNTPLTALHPIPSLLHGPHGDIRRSQMTCTGSGPGLSGGPGVPLAPSPGPLLPQQYLPSHPFFPRWDLAFFFRFIHLTEHPRIFSLCSPQNYQFITRHSDHPPHTVYEQVGRAIVWSEQFLEALRGGRWKMTGEPSQINWFSCPLNYFATSHVHLEAGFLQILRANREVDNLVAFKPLCELYKNVWWFQLSPECLQHLKPDQ